MTPIRTSACDVTFTLPGCEDLPAARRPGARRRMTNPQGHPEMTKPDVEAVAEIVEPYGFALLRRKHLPEKADALCERARAKARDILALPGLAPAPAGWKLVPEQPTREMWAAMGTAVVHLMQRGNLNHDALSEAVYRAAYENAPAAQPTPDTKEGV